MQLGIVKNRFLDSIKNIYNFGSSSIQELYDLMTIPVLGIKNNVVVYTNLLCQKKFCSEDFKVLAKESSVVIQNTRYAKIKVHEYRGTIFYILNKQVTYPKISETAIPCVILDRESKIIESNQAFLDNVVAHSGAKVRDLQSVIDKEDFKIVENYIANYDKLDNYCCIEVRFTIANEKAYNALLYIEKLKDTDFFKCHFIDITHYKNLEANLVHSQKMQAIGQLAGGIAHDFNNLLTAILGFCDLLLIKHPAGDPSFVEIMQIKQNGNRAANLVKQLLAISRKQVLKPKALDISDVIGELGNLIRRLIGEKVKLNIVHGRNLPLVKVDQSQLEQVIMNLCINARDAILVKGKSGDITVKSKYVKLTKEYNLKSTVSGEKIPVGRYVMIEIIDTGAGIPKNIVGRIFEPFFSTKEIGAGTGLGLSTVYAVTSQIGGYIEVDSEEGEGSKFCVYLKAFNLNSKDDDMDEEENDYLTEDYTGDATILLVEDEAPVRIFSKHALTNKGYKIIEAENAEKALGVVKARGKEIDIIISDVIMPGMDGPSLISEIQKILPDVKVIFISGYVKEAFSKESNPENQDNFHFLQKPFTLQQLVSKVKEVLALEVS